MRGDLLDPDSIRAALEAHRPDAIVHFAALIEVGESMRAPGRYYRNNVTGTLNLLQSMVETRKVPLVFSSTAAVYGTRWWCSTSSTSATTPCRSRTLG